MKSQIKIYLRILVLVFYVVNIHTADAQVAQMNISHTQYDDIKASRIIKTTMSLKIKGKVKSVMEITPALKDSLLYNFSLSGFLTFTKTGDKINSGTNSGTQQYFYDKNGALIKIHSVMKYQQTVTDKLFNTNGYLEKVETTGKTYDDPYRQIANYTYSDAYSKVIVNYSYPKSSQTWDYIRKETITFSFDKRGRLTKERNITKMSESVYGSTTTIVYDSILGLPTYVSYRADCAGSNSCLDLQLTIQYDERGNRIMESMSDFTIRNATWSYGYYFKAKYNLNNEIIEEYKSKEEHQNFSAMFKQQIDTPKDYDKNKSTYEYDYDANGNWIAKYATNKKQRELISKRMIEYY